MKNTYLKYLLLVLVLIITGDCNALKASECKREDGAFCLPIALSGSLQNPAWSPDGNSIVFTRFRNGYNQGPADLIVYDLTTATTRTLVSDGSDNVNLPGSCWNQNSNQVVFSSSREPHDEIYIINANEVPGNEVKITDRVQLVAYEPSLSPDGQWVVFESHQLDVEENGIITKYRIDHSEPYEMLTAEDKDCRQPNWSSDGEHILYQTFDGNRWEIWIMNIDGSEQHKLTSGLGDKTDAAFSPDGQWVVYSADGPAMEFANLFMISIAGGVPRKITHYNGYDGAPSWSSNGKQVVFESSSGDPEEMNGTTIWVINLCD